jgi:hypothetical protein
VTAPRRVSAAVLLALALFTDSALAQRADRPSTKVGDQWQFAAYYSVPSTAPSRVWVVTSVTPTGIEGTENGEPLILTPELNVLESPRHKDSNPKTLSFPLEVGKRWRYASDWVFKAKGAKGSSRVEVVVVDYGKVQVRAASW